MREQRSSAVANLGLATLSLVLFLTFLDNTVVSATLANMQATLHAGVAGLQWVVNSYALVFASFMLAAGALGDLFGRKRIMLAGVAVFCAGSVLGALAPNIDVLIAARAVMGIGAAASEPGTLSMIRHIYLEPPERARALGVWAAVSGLALAMGPLVGGTLVGLWSWRAVFWFNVFFGLMAFVAGALVLPESTEPVRRRFDFGGLVFGAGAIALMAFAVMNGETHGYRTWWVVALFVVGVVSLAAFIVAERRNDNPILNIGYFRRRAFAGANVIALTSYFSIFSIFFFVALYLQEVGSSSGYATALDFVPMAGGMIVAAILTGRWVAASGARIPMIVGCLLSCVGIVLTVVLLTPHSTVSTLGGPLGLAGVGFGTVMVPVTATGLSSIPAAHSGMAASMTNTSRELGAVAGVTILGSIVNGQLTVNLLGRLTAIGVPKDLQSLVVSAITTGSIGGEAKKYIASGGTIATIVKEVVQAAYGAFSHGLDISLGIAAGLMFASAFVAAFTMGGRQSARSFTPGSSCEAEDERSTDFSFL